MATETEQQIEHSHIHIRGLNLHVAQSGKGELGTMVFLHGFPEIWYTWRHQMLAVAAAWYRAVAPDWRGYGLSDQPPYPEAASYDDLVEDLLAILDALSVPQGQCGELMSSSVPKMGKLILTLCPASSDMAFWHSLWQRILEPCQPMILLFDTPTTLVVLRVWASLSFTTLPEGFYILHWREPGRAEADFGRYDVKRVVRTIYILFSRSEIPIAKEHQEIMDLADLLSPLPEWFTEEDLAVYASLYKKSGFRYPLEMPYRSPQEATNGEKDYVFKFPGVEAVLKDGIMEKFAPDLKITYIPEGSHFVQEQFPDKVNELLIGFLKDHPAASIDALDFW